MMANLPHVDRLSLQGGVSSGLLMARYFRDLARPRKAASGLKNEGHGSSSTEHHTAATAVAA